MKTKVSHSLLLLLAAAPLAFAQVPVTPAISDLPPAPSVAAEPPASGGDAGSPFSPVRPSVPAEAAAGEPLAPSGLPDGPSATAAGPVPLPPTPGRAPAAPAPELPPPTPPPPSLPGLSPAPALAPPPPPPVGVPAQPVAPRVMQPYPASAAGAPPNIYYQNSYTTPNVMVAGNDPHAMAGNYAPAPRGEQVIHDIKLKVLQRHYESTLSEAVEAEKAAIFASGGEKEALTAKAKALYDFAAKLEVDLRALPGNARTAAVQNTVHVYGSSASANGFTPPPHERATGAGTPVPGLRIEAVPGDGSGPVPAPVSSDYRGRKRSAARSGGGATGSPEPYPVPAQ